MLDAVGILCSTLYPLLFLIIYHAEEFTVVVLGDRWIGLGEAIQIFCIGTFFNIPAFHSAVFNAKGHTRAGLKVTVMFNLFYVCGLIIAYTIGTLLGFVLAFATATAIGGIYRLIRTAAFIKLPILAVFKPLLMYSLIGLSVLIGPLIVDSFVDNASIFMMMSKAFLGLIIYGAVCLVIGTKEMRMFLALIRA